jgi:hypothetical protein
MQGNGIERSPLRLETSRPNFLTTVISNVHNLRDHATSTTCVIRQRPLDVALSCISYHHQQNQLMRLRSGAKRDREGAAAIAAAQPAPKAAARSRSRAPASQPNSLPNASSTGAVQSVSTAATSPVPKKVKQADGPSRSHEMELLAKGCYCRVIGIDEAGRGPLAGPVVAAACYVPPHVHIEGVGVSVCIEGVGGRRVGWGGVGCGGAGG